MAKQESSGGPAAASSQDRSSEVGSPPDERPTENQVRLTTADDPSGVRTVNTGDSDFWPSYDFPLVIRVDVPELPETITEPSPPVPGREDG